MTLDFLQLDLKNPRPQFAGDKQPVRGRIVGDAVEDRLLLRPLLDRKQAAQIDPSEDPPRARIDAYDLVAVPDIGVNLTLKIRPSVNADGSCGQLLTIL